MPVLQSTPVWVLLQRQDPSLVQMPEVGREYEQNHQTHLQSPGQVKRTDAVARKILVLSITQK